MDRREFVIGGACFGVAQALRARGRRPGFSGLSGRPAAGDRLFRSPAIEQAIAETCALIGSPELARIFQNCFPNTLDTTVFPGDYAGKPDTYVITGDIDAMWLRDSGAQVWPYLEFAKEDRALGELLEGVIRRHTRLILLDSYANAFTREPGDPPLRWAAHDKTAMRPGVAERKWEIDSLCYPVRLAYGYWKATGATAPFDAEWMKAAKRIETTFQEQLRLKGRGSYCFQRDTTRSSDTLSHRGYGNPARPDGLICSGFRPSDDACQYPHSIPGNLFAVRTLERMAEIAVAVYADPSFARSCEVFASQVRAAVQQHGVVRDDKYGEILAYEEDGYGHALLMDDANVPGLLSLAYLELLPENDALYQRTRAFALSQADPYFFRGTAGEGIGGPHVGRGSIWPMSIIVRGLTSSSDAEIVQCLQTLCMTTAGTYFMHESFQMNDPRTYTRPWFAWANGLMGELVLKLRRERPALLREFRVRT